MQLHCGIKEKAYGWGRLDTGTTRTPRRDGPLPPRPRVPATQLDPAQRQPEREPRGHGAAGFLPDPITKRPSRASPGTGSVPLPALARVLNRPRH